MVDMIDMKPKDSIKLDTIPLDKTYPEKSVLPEGGLQIFISACGNNTEMKKHGWQTLSGVKMRND